MAGVPDDVRALYARDPLSSLPPLKKELQIAMGRAGIEPATLGLKVHLNKLQREAPKGKTLHMA